MSKRQDLLELKVMAACIGVAVFGAALATSGNHLVEVIGVGLIIVGMASLSLLWFIY